MIERIPIWILEHWETIYTIIGVPSLAGFIVGTVKWSVHQTPKHKYAKVRKNFLKKINDVYHLFQDGKESKIVYSIGRHTEVAQLIDKLDQSIFEMKSCYRDCPREAVYEFYNAYFDFITPWHAVRFQLEPYYKEDHLTFSRKYDYLSQKLTDLKNQVDTSLPDKERKELME